MALADANIAPAAHLINALIIISVMSAGNSSLCVASRTILYMARGNKAPKFLGAVDKRGVPWTGLTVSNLTACMAFISMASGADAAYEALVALSGVATFIVWGTIGFIHTRFRRAFVAANVFLVFIQGYTAFLNPFNATTFVTNYILLPVFVILFLGYKYWYNTKWVKLEEEVDLQTGRRPKILAKLRMVKGPEDKEDFDWLIRRFI